MLPIPILHLGMVRHAWSTHLGQGCYMVNQLALLRLEPVTCIFRVTHAIHSAYWLFIACLFWVSWPCSLLSSHHLFCCWMCLVPLVLCYHVMWHIHLSAHLACCLNFVYSSSWVMKVIFWPDGDVLNMFLHSGDDTSHCGHPDLVRSSIVIIRAMSYYHAMCPWATIFSLYCYSWSCRQTWRTVVSIFVLSAFLGL